MMNTADYIQAIFAGVCLYAAIVHLLIGLRSQPRDRVHLTFAAISLLFGIYSINIVFLNAAIDDGSVSHFLATDKWGLLTNYLAYACLFWFIAVYTYAGQYLVPVVTTVVYVVIALSNYVLPYTWVYTTIELSATRDPVLTLSPWYSVEGPLTGLFLMVYPAYYITRQYRRGEREAARFLAVAVGIFAATYAWDIFLVEYDIVPFILLQQYGFLAFIVIMSLRLTSQIVEAEKEVRRLNIELDHQVEARTAELSMANQDLISARDQAQAANRAKSVFLANMSHELRTPLNAILGYAQIISRDDSLKPEHYKGIKAINRSGDHLLMLIKNVLEISKIEVGRAVLNPSPLSIDSLISDMEMMFGNRTREKRLEL